MDLKTGTNFLSRDTDGVSLDRSRTKIAILIIFGAVFSFLSGFFLQVFMVDGGIPNILFSFLTAIGFLTIFLLCVFFIKAGWIVNLAVAIQCLAFFALFYDRLSAMVSVGLGLGIGLFVSGVFSGRAELENSLEIKFWKISKKILPKAIAGTAIFVGVICASFVDVNEKEFFISRETFNAIVSPITGNGFIDKIIPGLELSGSMEEAIRNIATREIENNPQLKNLPDSVKNQLVGQAVQQVQKQASGATGINLNFQNNLSNTLYDFLAVKFYSLPENMLNSAPILVAAFIFLVIISFTWPIRLIISIISILLYEILLALGFGAIILEGRSKENVVLK